MYNSRIFAIIDVQNVFLNNENEFLVERIRKFIEEKRDFFHSIVLFKFVNFPGSIFVNNLNYSKAMLPQETEVAEPLKNFSSNIFRRTTFSIFTPEFVEYLKNLKDPEVFLSGLDSDACVMASAYHGFDLGYKIKIIGDLIYSKNSEYNFFSLKILNRNLHPLVIKSEDIV